jgi:hypothetical protein
MPDPANYIFLPWVQSGAAANIPDAATDTLGPVQPGVVSLSVKLVVNADTVEKAVRLYGPGEITGIDPQQVVRTEPRHLTSDFEPNYFPGIEFDRPDFPWLFTPAKSDAQSRLRPWLCLVVVRKQQGVALRPAITTPLPALEITAPARPGDELPDLSESWAWAHAQVTGSQRSQLKDTLAKAPARSVSRLLCPRRLDPNTEYIACVVPTFELGRKAGLALPIQPADEQRLDPAWLSGKQSPAEVTLPVYYHWAFRTGAGGDFEELVRRLEAREMPPGVGKRPMDISQPGFKLQPPLPPGTALGLEGALRVAKTKPDGWPAETRLPFQTELSRIINTPWQIATRGGDQDPVVGPPLYGCWQAAVHEVDATNPPSPQPPAAWPPPFWLNELNLDPRHRVTAGVGTEVIQREQESLMTSAWEQLGELDKVNQRLRQAQLSRAVNNVYHAKTFSRFSEEAFLKIVAPAKSRVVLEESPTGQPSAAPPVKMLLAQRLAASVVPSNTVSASLRRITRPRGAINRQYAQAGVQGARAMIRQFNQLAEPGEIVWVEDAPPAGAKLAGDEPWNWVNANPTPYAGALAHQSNINPAVHQHFFFDAPNKLDLGAGDKLFAYVFIDPVNTPSQVMLQWHADNTWEHRAYWGANSIGWGVDGTESRRRMGNLPAVGSWIRLEVTAADVGLEGKSIDGVAFTLFGGRATWDRAGKTSPLYRGAVTVNQVSDAIPMPNAQGMIWVQNTPGVPPHWERGKAIDVQMHDTFRLNNLTPTFIGAKQPVPVELVAFRDAARAHQEYLGRIFGVGILLFFSATFVSLRAKLVPQDLKSAALIGLNPNRTVGARVLANVIPNSLPPPRPTSDPLDTIMAAPTFPQPMYEALRDISPAFLFPGLEQVPPDSVQLLETNAQFVESFLVGLNAEMSRELLWRGYPTDQRGTYFQHFWDTLDTGPQTPPDIPPIHLWGKHKLGDNATGAAAGNKLVLLIRGELLRRYPNTVIYAVQAVRNGAQLDLPPDPVAEIHPIFRGTLDPDVTFLGFDLTADAATAGAGIFFVLQQQPTEPRFGLDAAPFSAQAGKPEELPVLQSWDDLNWGHLAKDETELKALAHVSVNNARLTPTGNDQGRWGRNSAHMAYITKQLPTRIAIHATQMLPTKQAAGDRR